MDDHDEVTHRRFIERDRNLSEIFGHVSLVEGMTEFNGKLMKGRLSLVEAKDLDGHETWLPRYEWLNATDQFDDLKKELELNANQKDRLKKLCETNLPFLLIVCLGLNESVDIKDVIERSKKIVEPVSLIGVVGMSGEGKTTLTVNMREKGVPSFSFDVFSKNSRIGELGGDGAAESRKPFGERVVDLFSFMVAESAEGRLGQVVLIDHPGVKSPEITSIYHLAHASMEQTMEIGPNNQDEAVSKLNDEWMGRVAGAEEMRRFMLNKLKDRLLRR